MSTNREFWKSLKAPTSNFYLCDFHVHSPGSADTRIGDRFEALTPEEKILLPQLSRLPVDLEDYDKKAVSGCPVAGFYDLILKRRNEIAHTQGLSVGNDWAFVAITDHNVAEYSSEISRHAWDKKKTDRLVILPGIELDVVFSIAGVQDECGIHILCVFPPLTSASDIRLAIVQANNNGDWSPGGALKTNSVSMFVNKLRNSTTYPAICIAAHVSSSKGIQNEIKKSLLSSLDAAIARTKGEIESHQNTDLGELKARLAMLEAKQADTNTAHEQVLHEIGSCGFDALQVRSKADEKHYRRLHRFKPDDGRAIPMTCSDAHSVGGIFTNDDAFSFLKLSDISASMTAEEIFAEIKQRGLRYGDTRFSYSIPNHVTKWISGIEIRPDAVDAATFWPYKEEVAATGKSFSFPLSRNLNCLIGGRGSGKSAAIEAIAFLTNPSKFDGYNKKRESEHPEWYKRACATIRGCQVRICWQSSGEVDFSSLEKQTLFESRYFDANHKHGELELTDINGKTLLGGDIIPPKVTLFRIHEIEDAAQPNNLRDLFDRINGDEVVILNNEIKALCLTLKTQRKTLCELATSISNLTDENKPLREYAKRKRQFLDVNKPEVKQKYAEIDNASAAEIIADDAVEDWGTIAASVAADQNAVKTKEYFIGLANRLKNESGEIRPNCNLLFALVDETANPNRVKRISDALEAAGDVFKEFGKDIQAVRDTIASLHKGFRDELTKQGLPPGGKEREAKKKAYEEAESALLAYRRFCSQWDEALSVRAKQHEQLEDRCKLRTKLRKETAERLTKQLALDLDQSVLLIEADARPMADKSEFEKWLGDHLAPTSIVKFKDLRIRAILDKGVMPAELRDVLLSNPGAQPDLLVTKESRASEGGIGPEDNEKYINDTIARCRSMVELAKSDVDPEFWNDLPEEIKSGLWQFNIKVSEPRLSRLDAVLELDEVVYDDLPEIKLNDRPGDPLSKPRPLYELSPGQRCSAILPILLLTGDTPLLIDQPEDNLDNRLIRQVIVNILATIKLRRQVIVATHNPNLPVLGDAEQTIILRAVREMACELQGIGNLDSRDVVTYITDIMEGGREAFQYRQTIYQSHWDGPVAPKGL